MTYRSGVDVTDRPREEIEADAHIEGNLATEATFVILHMLEKVVQVVSSSDLQHSIIGMTLKILLHALARNQSTTVLPHMFATQRSLVFKVGTLGGICFAYNDDAFSFIAFYSMRKLNNALIFAYCY